MMQVRTDTQAVASCREVSSVGPAAELLLFSLYLCMSAYQICKLMGQSYSTDRSWSLKDEAAHLSRARAIRKGGSRGKAEGARKGVAATAGE
jgi:hypothetical protein